jgi:hypothetical protein
MRTASRRRYFSKARERASSSPALAFSSSVNVEVGDSIARLRFMIREMGGLHPAGALVRMKGFG